MQVTSTWLVLLPSIVYLGILVSGLWYLSTCRLSHLKSCLYGIIGFGVVSIWILFNSHLSHSAFYLNLVVCMPILVFPVLIGSFRIIKAKRLHKNGI